MERCRHVLGRPTIKPNIPLGKVTSAYREMEPGYMHIPYTYRRNQNYLGGCIKDVYKILYLPIHGLLVRPHEERDVEDIQRDEEYYLGHLS